MTSKYIDNATYASSGYKLTGANQDITIGAAGVIGGSGIVGTLQEAFTIVNQGSITAVNPNNSGIYLRYGGTVTNSGTAASIVGYSEGVYIKYGVGVVNNTGMIETHSRARGGDEGVSLNAGGTLNNLGAASFINSGGDGVRMGGLGTVSNAGTIVGGEYGISIRSGVVSNNGTKSSILGDFECGVDVLSGAGTVSNAGTITSVFSVAVALNSGGSIVNAGAAALIRGGAYAIEIINGVGGIVNSGKILEQFVLKMVELSPIIAVLY